VPCFRNDTSVCIVAAARDVLEQLAVYNLTNGEIEVEHASTSIERVVTAIRDVAIDVGRRED
jgi:hypothetical protein